VASVVDYLTVIGAVECGDLPIFDVDVAKYFPAFRFLPSFGGSASIIVGVCVLSIVVQRGRKSNKMRGDGAEQGLLEVTQ
jgi:hypothetical protein